MEHMSGMRNTANSHKGHNLLSENSNKEQIHFQDIATTFITLTLLETNYYQFTLPNLPSAIAIVPYGCLIYGDLPRVDP